MAQRPQRMSPEQAAGISAAAFAGLLEQLSYLDAADAQKVRSAYLFADRAHSDQWRSSGDPYITHPIAVTALCATWLQSGTISAPIRGLPPINPGKTFSRP